MLRMTYVLLIYSLFFFFKQKTAYEMRISDWSSDVCSSDLPWIKSAMIWAGVIVALLLFVSMFDSRTASSAGAGIAYSEFRAKVQEGQVKDVAIAADRISGTLTSGQEFNTVPVTEERNTVRMGKSGSGRVDLGCGRNIKK